MTEAIVIRLGALVVECWAVVSEYRNAWKNDDVVKAVALVFISGG
jgi:hypothetical protein